MMAHAGSSNPNGNEQRSMKLRFSIRDLLWLTALCAVLVAWWMDHKPQRYEINQMNTTSSGTFPILVDNETGEIHTIGDKIN
jgi:hypothetical protein